MIGRNLQRCLAAPPATIESTIWCLEMRSHMRKLGNLSFALAGC